MASEEESKIDKSALDVPKGWGIRRLDEVASVIDPWPSHRAPKIFKNGYPYVGIGDISENGEIEFEKTRKVGESVVLEQESNMLFDDRYIGLGKVGTVGKVVWVKSKPFRYALSATMVLIKPTSKINKNFLYYIFKSPNFQGQISRFMTGTTRPTIGILTLRTLEIPVPSLEEQLSISKILSDLDAKIELNQKMNKTLEAIAQAIFKHWFIDFEFPNEEGKPYKSSGGEMVDSELGEIPNGWEVKKITEIGRLKNGINYTRDEKGDEEFYIVNVRDISKSKFIIKDDLNVIKFDSTKCKDYLLNQNDIIIARSASPGESSLILGNIDNVIHSGFSIRYRLSNPNFKWYVYLLLQHSKNILFRYSIGTALKSLNQTAVGNMSIIMPSVDVLRKFNSIDIINKIMSNLLESKALLNIRDLLLPKLIMGKIRVPLEE